MPKIRIDGIGEIEVPGEVKMHLDSVTKQLNDAQEALSQLQTVKLDEETEGKADKAAAEHLGKLKADLESAQEKADKATKELAEIKERNDRQPIVEFAKKILPSDQKLDDLSTVEIMKEIVLADAGDDRAGDVKAKLDSLSLDGENASAADLAYLRSRVDHIMETDPFDESAHADNRRDSTPTPGSTRDDENDPDVLRERFIKDNEGRARRKQREAIGKGE